MYVGIDLGKRIVACTLLKADGTEVLTTKGANTRDGWEIIRRSLPLDGETSAVIEACCNWSQIYDLLSSWGWSVVVAHPGQLRLIAESKKKTDTVDSRTLARLLHAGFVPAIAIPPRELR